MDEIRTTSKWYPFASSRGTRELNWGQFVGLKSIIGDHVIQVTAKYKAKKLLSHKPVECETESKIDIESYADTVAHDDNESKKMRKELAKIEKALNQIGQKPRTLSVEIVENEKAKPSSGGNA